MLLDLALDAIFVWGPGHIVTYWNRGAEATYGYSRDEAIGRSALELLDTHFPVPLAEIAAQLAKDGTWEGELSQCRRDGTRLTVDGRWAVRHGSDGQAVDTIEVSRDITVRKQAEGQLSRWAAELEKANLELARSNDELAQFAYVASHDLAEPLRAISGPLSMVARRYQGELDEEAHQFIGFAVDGCRRMQSLIDGLLVMSRVGRLEGDTGPTDSAAVVRSVLTSLGPTIDQTGTAVEVGDLPMVLAEPEQLGRVVQNLISNGIKFVPAGVTPRISVTAEPDGAEWRFSVTDNGIGIEPRHRDRIFGMFKRLHGRDAYPGTGIGLALVKKIVERHGGQVGVDDAPTGTGCRFWFTLPTAGGTAS
jgi:PAS domain S-box-containing protein